MFAHEVSHVDAANQRDPNLRQYLLQTEQLESSSGRMGRLLVEWPTATFAWRRARCLADSLVNSLYLLTYPD